MLDEPLLRRRLAERGLSPTLFVPAETGSTNNDAKTHARSAPVLSPGTAVLFAADRQTAGRGRQGKTFVSPPGGLYMSLLLPADALFPQSGGSASPVGVTGCAAVAACRAIEECAGIPARIKWVNDILIERLDPVEPSAPGRYGKAAGILCELTSSPDGRRYLVIGIGVNVVSAPAVEGANFPPAALTPPDSPSPVEAEGLAACLTEKFLAAAADGFRFADAVDEYRARSIVTGREIVFVRNGASFSGTVLSVEADGTLRVLTPSGEVFLDSGEISVRIR